MLSRGFRFWSISLDFLNSESVNEFFITSGNDSRILTAIPVIPARVISTANDDVICQVRKVTVTGKMFCIANMTDNAPMISPDISGSSMDIFLLISTCIKTAGRHSSY